MCGIAGMLASGRWDAPETAARFANAIAHRGPDDRGCSIERTGDSTLLLVHSRLAIIDLSPSGHQPMRDPSTNNQIVYNGELYNFRELRRELGPDESWRSTSDTEVILQAYARWGVNCLERLGGMFALAIWDAAAARLLLARDRFGIKPLYYVERNGQFAFGSECRALLASGIATPSISLADLSLYLRHQTVPTPRTLLRDVRMVEPASFIEVRDGRILQRRRYWTLPSRDVAAPTRNSRGTIAELLRDSVRGNLISDVPVACFLSGGVDSTAIVALTKSAGTVPRTFTIAFEQETLNEADTARRTARRFGTDHTEVRLGAAEVLASVKRAVSRLDHPTGDALNTYIISDAVRSAGVKVALSGLGGDELFGGYSSFRHLPRYMRMRPLLRLTPVGIRRRAASVAHHLFNGGTGKSAKFRRIVGDALPFEEAYLELRSIFAPATAKAIVGGYDDAMDPFREMVSASEFDDLRTRISYAELTTYMTDVLLRDTDQMSMVHALEVRVPFLDHRLVEQIFSLPAGQKWHPGRPKSLLLHALDGRLPEEVKSRPKNGFVLPMAEWMRGPLREFCRERLHEGRLRREGALEAHAVDELWSDFLAGTRPWAQPWLLVVLEEWASRHGVSVAR